MGSVFAHISVSVDGYVADDAGGLDWWSADQEFHRYIDGMLESISGMVFGRVAFDALAQFWPTAGPEVSSIQRQRMHELPKYVLSHAPLDATWHNSHLLAGEPRRAIESAARDAGGDIAVFAGAGAVRAALASGVLDELRLVVHPVLVGSGLPLFDGTQPAQSLRVRETTPFGSGAHVVRYSMPAPEERPSGATRAAGGSPW